MRLDCRHTTSFRSLMIAVAACTSLSVQAQSGSSPALSVNVAAGRHAISPNIYGIASYGLDATFAQEIKVPNVRWGGDGTSRYNWMVDSSNAGFDWYFMGGNGQTTPVPSASADLMVNTYRPANALMTIPILPYVNKSAAWNCSFPVSVYGAQQSTNPYVHPNGDNCGNSIASNGTQLTDTNIYANHIDNTTSLQQQWVQHLVSTFGTGAQGGVKFYQLDNEPFGWSNTHRDVMPNGATYATISSLGQQYAAAVKQADSTALVLGPSDFTLGGWVGNASQQGGLFAGQYYLQQMSAYDTAHSQRVLDYFDEHYYFDTSTPAAQLASTRTLWDATYNGGTWVEQYDFNGPMQLIPRFRNWISTYYPGTLLSLSEYSIDSGQKSIVDALAEMDVLGIFGREPLDFANMWSAPGAQDPIAFAFRMFRNYDGNGSQFGDTSASAVSTDQGQLSIYAAQRSSDNAVTILVINKTTGALTSSLALSGVALPATAQVYTYAQGSLTAIAHAADAPINNGAVSYVFPAYAAVLFVVQPSVSAPAAGTTTTVAASANAIDLGHTVTFTVAVAATPGGAPSGTVTLLDGATSLGTTALSNGSANFAVTTLAAGTHSISASYAGDATDSASSSSPVTVTVTAPTTSMLPTTTALNASAGSAIVGQAIQLTATVSGTATPAGNVQFVDGSTALGSAALSAGNAVLTTSSLSVGSHSITAVYGGDATHTGSSSSAVTITIAAAVTPPPGPAADYGLTLSSSTLAVTSGNPGSLMVSVAPANGFSASLSFACTGLPSGWACSFAPATLAGGSPQSTKLTVSGASASQWRRAPAGLFLAMVSPFSLLLLRFSRRRVAACCCLLLFAAGFAFSGCSTPTSSTPAVQSYNVTVTASGTSAPTHTQVFALTVSQ